MNDTTAPTPEELSAYLDGELEPARHAEISYYLAANRRLSESVASQRAIQDGLKALASASNASHPTLAPHSTTGSSRRPARAPHFRWLQPLGYALAGAATAAVLFAVAWLPGPNGDKAFVDLAPSSAAFFLERASKSYEFSGSDNSTISSVLPSYPVAQRSTETIEAAGFILKGGRVTTVNGAGAILLIYQDRAGGLLGLTIWPKTSDPVALAPSNSQGVKTIFWTDSAYSYALTARQDMESLRRFRQAYLSR